MSLQVVDRDVYDGDVTMLPTPERMRHDRFNVSGGVVRVVTTVRVLLDAGDIGDDEAAAAARWHRDYVFADHGVMDDLRVGAASTERGDVHTWMLARGKSAVRIGDVKAALGLCGHVRLQMMLGQEMSFSAMARILYPETAASRARMKVSAQCAFLFEQLAAFYRERANKNKITR